MAQSDYGLRADKTPKGEGFLGALKRKDGRVSTEISIGVEDVIPGQEMEIPTLVPTMTQAEVAYLLNHDPEQTPIPKSIINKAIDFARQRVSAGQPVFAQPGEQMYHIYPQFERIQMPTSGFSDAVIRPIVMHRDTTRTR